MANNFEKQVDGLPRTNIYRGEFHEGDTSLLNKAAVSATNTPQKTHALLAAHVDGQNVAVWGKSEETAIYGVTENGIAIKAKSKDNGIAVWGESENYEAMHAETRSLTTAAIAAYQKNPESQTAAFFAKHDGGGMAGVFDGSVIVGKKLIVNNVNILNQLHLVENAIKTLADKMGAPSNISSLQPYVTVEAVQDTQLKVVMKGFGFTPASNVEINYSYFNSQTGNAATYGPLYVKTDSNGNFVQETYRFTFQPQRFGLTATDITSGTKATQTLEFIPAP